MEASITFEEKFIEGSANCAVTYKDCEDKNEIMKSYGFTKTGEIIEKPDFTKPMKNWLGLGIYFTTPEIFKYLIHEEFMNVFNSMECLNLRLEGTYHNINTETEFKNANSPTI